MILLFLFSNHSEIIATVARISGKHCRGQVGFAIFYKITILQFKRMLYLHLMKKNEYYLKLLCFRV